jgi:hypothetical protein
MGHKRAWAMKFSKPVTKNEQKGIRLTGYGKQKSMSYEIQ